MEPRVNYALVGLFLLVLGAAFILASLWLVGVGPAGEMRTYLVYLEESVAGLTVESGVKYQGVDVGKVLEIGLDPHDPSRARLLIEVRKDTPVNVDTIASLATQGLTGLVYFIELRGGGPDSPPLKAPPGAEHAVIPSEPSLTARLWETGFALLEDVQAAAAALRAALADVRGVFTEENRQALSTSFQELARTTERLSRAAGTLDDYLEAFEPVLDDLARAARSLPDLANCAETTLDKAGAAASEVRRAVDHLDDLMADMRPGLVALARDGLPQVVPLLQDLRELTGRLGRLAEELESDPSLLLQGRARRPGPGER